MKGRATTTISIYRGSGQNEYADPVDDNTTPMVTGMLASIIEQNKRAFLAADSRKTVIRNSIGRVKHGTDVIEGDRVKDEKTGIFYFVEAVGNPQSPVNFPDVRMVLRAVLHN